MKKRWIALLCAVALAVTMMGGASAAGVADTGTGPMTAGAEWNGIDLYASESAGQVKVIAKCDTGKMDVQLMTGDGKFLKKLTLDAESDDNSLVYYIKRDAGQSGRYHLKWRGVNGQNATGTYFWASIPADGSQSRWDEVFGDQPWSADGTVSVRVNSIGAEERLPIYTSLYPYDLREVAGALSDPEAFQGENGGLSHVNFRRDLSIAPMTYGNLPAMFYRFNANGKKVLIKLNALSGAVGDCDLLIKNETTGEFLAWVPGIIPGNGGGIILPTKYGTRYGIYAASGSDTLGVAQLSITDDLPINEAEIPDDVLLAGARKSGTFDAKATWDGIGLQVNGSVEAFRLVVQCDTGAMTVRVVDDNNHLVKPTQFLVADSDSEAASFNLVIERAKDYTGSYAIWWIGADGQAATGSYAWAAVKENFEPGVDGQLPTTAVTGTENSFRFPYKNISIDGGGGDYSGCAFPFKLENNEAYFRVAVRNDLAPEIGNITVGIYREGDEFAYVSYDARPGEWTPPIVVRGVPGTTYTVILRKNAGTPELVQGLFSIKCAPNIFE